MVFTLFLDGSPTNSDHKSARDALKPLLDISQRKDMNEIEKFRHLKRRIQIYMSILQVRVREVGQTTSTSFDTHFETEGQGAFPTDLIFDPSEDPNRAKYIIDESLDRILFQDILTIWNDSTIDYLTAVTGTQKSTKLVQKIGAKYYISIPSSRRTEF